MYHSCYGEVGIKNEKHKYNTKSSELCQYNGIILRVSIYLGQPYNDDKDLGRTGAIVLQLAHDLFLVECFSLFVEI